MRTALVLLLALTLLPSLSAAEKNEDVAARVDAVFEKYALPDTPGCAVGVARGGRTILERGYGSANLEHDDPITPATIFEAGSVSKQFTAAAILLLAQEGRLSLDAPIRNYLPELSEAATPITIREILSHTSGLRDWGAVVSLAGWPRGTRRFTQAHVLEVLSAQRALNFPAGTAWSYSNSGYNLAAMIVERVSGKSFPEFTREQIFAPLGMSHSSWRDDYTRVVKGRATAYDAGHDAYHTDMDIENIYGNCCLLTTVGDLLKWNENFRTKTVGGTALIRAMETPAVLADGRRVDYGFGLFIGTNPAQHEIYHSGATAGYRAYLTRYPDDDLSIALLCNRSDAPIGALVQKVSRVFVAHASVPLPTPSHEPQKLPAVGLYRDLKSDAIVRVFTKENALHFGLHDEGPELVPLGGNRLRVTHDIELRVGPNELHLITIHKPEARYVKVAEASPNGTELSQYTGVYISDEASAIYDVSVEHGRLVARLAPSRVWKLEPTYVDGFSVGGDLIRFTRNAAGRVDGFDVKTDFSVTEGSARLERMHFRRR